MERETWNSQADFGQGRFGEGAQSCHTLELRIELEIESGNHGVTQAIDERRALSEAIDACPIGRGDGGRTNAERRSRAGGRLPNQAQAPKDVPDAALWLPSSKESVVERLVEAVQERQHVLLTGEPGVGKTCTLRALRRRLPEAGFRLTYRSNATLGCRDFYRQLCHALGLSPKATAAAVFTALNEHVEDLGRERIHPVFRLDAAHLLRQDVLEHLHVLANYQWDQKPILTLVLVSLPELWARLRLHKNRSLWSRIHCRVAIDDPTPEDSVEYVSYRLRSAGTERQLFTSDALTVLHEDTSGILRDIDRVAGNALRRAARRKLKEIDRSLVSALLTDET